jgi:putative redox protein
MMSKITKAVLTGNGTYQTRLTTGNYEFYSDEPIAAGGTGTAPDPMELLFGGLAACTIITLKMYLDRKGWKYDSLDVSITTQVDRVENAAILNAEERKRVREGRLRRIHKIIHLKSDMNQEQLERVVEIAGKCPVNKLLKESAFITDEVQTV